MFKVIKKLFGKKTALLTPFSKQGFFDAFLAKKSLKKAYLLCRRRLNDSRVSGQLGEGREVAAMIMYTTIFEDYVGKNLFLKIEYFIFFIARLSAPIWPRQCRLRFSSGRLRLFSSQRSPAWQPFQCPLSEVPGLPRWFRP